MRKLILALTALTTLTVVSCNQNDVSPASTTSLSGARVGTVTSGTSTHGNNETIITADQLPAAAITYLSTNFPGYVIVKAEKKTSSAGVAQYEVKFIANNTTREIYFDEAGTVTKTKIENDGKNGSSNEIAIMADQLPAAAITYLSTNFPGYVIVKAEKKTSSAGVARYEVKFTANNTTREVYFDAVGTVTKIEVENNGKGGSSNEVTVPASQLPAAAITYLNTNFPGYVITKVEKKTNSAGVVRYEVNFAVKKAKRKANFDANGTLI